MTNLRKVVYAAVACCILFSQTNCTPKKEPDPETVEQIFAARTLGLAYLEESRMDEAVSAFQKLIELAPNEPLGYANLGLVHLRLGQYQQAETHIRKALDLAPGNADIRLMLAELLDVTDRRDEALQELRQNLQKEPDHFKTLYALAEQARNNNDNNEAERHLQHIVDLLPANLAARLQLAEALLRDNKADSALANLEEIRRQMPEFPAQSKEFFDKAIASLHAGDVQSAFSSTAIFHNFLKLTPLYQAGILELKGPGGALAGSPVLTFGRDISTLPVSQEAMLAAIQFTDVSKSAGLNILPQRKELIDPFSEPGVVVAVADFDRDRQQDVFISASDEMGNVERFLLKNDLGQFISITPTSGINHGGQDISALFTDFDNDGFLDIFLSNTAGNQLYRNIDVGKFANVTAKAGVGEAHFGHRALFADFDHDGDLDLFLANQSSDQLFRNNLDGTFSERAAAMGLADGSVGSRDAAFADFDDDGDLDLVVVQENGQLKLYSNLRQGQFADRAIEAGLRDTDASAALAVADINNDGFVDLLVTSLQGGATLFRNNGDGTFVRDQRSTELSTSMQNTIGLDADFFDFDNDGYIDLLITGVPRQTGSDARAVHLFRNDGSGIFLENSSILPEDLTSGQNTELLDYNEDGDIDFLLSSLDGRVRLLRNDGGNANKYLKVGLVAVRTGSGKNNHFGIGSKMELRAGDFYQMRVVTSPVTHFGLGQRTQADIVRILWPNGTPQNLFQPASDQDLVEEQILKGSCAFLYIWDGDKFTFHTDIMWRSALGMPLGIMGGESAFAAPLPTNEYVLIPGDKMQPQNGKYVLQVTEELWEAAYVDRLRLIAVDHPDSIDIFVNESFTPPPYPEHRIFQVSERRLPNSATDGSGADMLPALRERDGRYIDQLKPAYFQGMTRPHELILDPGELPVDQPVRLYLQGWIFPSDASINVAVSQSSAFEAISPQLQVPDANGDWQTVDGRIGFPMGKNKTMVIDLTGKFLSDDHRVRIRTNMEIYWDAAFFSVGEPQIALTQTALDPVAADLHYRGFSREYRKDSRYGPHWFDYGIVSTEPKWRDLTGNYTRYGDVRELLLASDSKVAILNSGDEMTVEFDAQNLPALKTGWKRDFLIYSDGWIKDGDLNTAHGQTVGPLPYQGIQHYPYGPSDAYPEDLAAYNKKYNTRRVTTEQFRRALSQQGK